MPLVPYILLAILSVLVSGPQLRSPYDVLRRMSIPFLGLAYILQWWVAGTSVNLSSVVIWLTLGMIGWWVVTTLVSPYRYVSVSELCVWVGSVVFIMTAFDGINLDGIKIVMIGIVANCLYAIMQNVFRYEPIEKLSNQMIFAPVGFIGNTNMLGNFLVVNFFLSLLLVDESRWWLFVSGLIAYTIWLTKCRGSYVGLFAGIVFMCINTTSDDIYTFGVIIVSGLLVAGVVKRQYVFDHITGKERLQYWKIAWEQIKRNPGFGIGLDCLKCVVPYIQKDLNHKTNGDFLKPDNYKIPYPQKCHNDYLQMVCDVGIPGLVAYLGLITLALISDASPVLKGGLVAALVTWLFMHNLHTAPTNLWIWFVLFSCLRSTSDYITPLYVIVAIIVVILATYRNLINDLICGFYFQRSLITKNADYLLKGLQYAPTDGNSLVQAGAAFQRKNDSINALDVTMRGIYNYDGAIRIWELWLNAAKTHLTLGGLLAAEACAKRSLELNPNFKDAEVFVSQINTILLKGYQVKRQEHNNEPKTNVPQHQRIRPDALNAGGETENQHQV
jgi:O-antigen ligase